MTIYEIRGTRCTLQRSQSHIRIETKLAMGDELIQKHDKIWLCTIAKSADNPVFLYPSLCPNCATVLGLSLLIH